MAIPGRTQLGGSCGSGGQDSEMRGTCGSCRCVKFGASRHIARIILSALRYNPKIRAAINVRIFGKQHFLCRKSWTQFIFPLTRVEEPENCTTMDWEIPEAVKSQKSIPKVVYDTGDLGKEPMIHCLYKCC